MGDFEGLYIAQLMQLAHGLLPYRDFAVSYPPLFLYTLYPFYVIGANFASLPIVLSDAATAVVIYYTVERLSGGRIALAAGLVYALSPFALYYEGYVWLSSQPMTFFAMLSVCLVLRNRPVPSFSALAVAILFKQEVLFLLPVLLFLVVHQNKRQLPGALAAFSGILIAVSLPFLVASPRGYLDLVSYSLLGLWQGLPTPEPVTTSAVCQNALVSASSTLMSCTFGSISYTQVVNNYLSPWELFNDALSHDVGVLASVVVIPIFLLLIPVLYSLRRHGAIVPLVCAYLGAGFLIVFSAILHNPYKYYYLPIYALLLMAAVNKRTLAVSMFAPVLAMITASFSFQELVPLLTILIMAALLDASRKRGEPNSSPTSNKPLAHREFGA